MRQTTLGRTNLKTTQAGLGCGGFSVLGLKKYGEAHAANIVRQAYNHGVRFFDTAAVYGTEPAVGIGLSGLQRDSYVISTKMRMGDEWRENPSQHFTKSLDNSLTALKTDYVDIYNLHGITPEYYPITKELLVPEMLKAQESGKIRFLGITEHFSADSNHTMLEAALDDDIFDVIMVGYNLLNPSAAKSILPRAIAQNVGVQCMHAVRQSLSNPPQLKIDIQRILDKGQGGPGLHASENALDFLMQLRQDGTQAASSVMDAAYRYCAHKAGINIVLTGTSSEAHLVDNLNSINSQALPDYIMEKLELLFGNVNCVSGQ